MAMAKVEELPVVEGCEAEKKTISIMKANVLSIVLFLVFGALCGLVYYAIWGRVELNISPEKIIRNNILLLVGLVAGIVVHELVHGLTWILLSHNGFRHLSFGVMKGCPYCHIDMPMVKRHYVIGALMPLYLVGIVPLMVAFFLGSLLWLLLGVIFVVSAIGDIMMVWAIRKEPTDALIYDHPSEIGCYVYHKTIQQ